MKAGSWSCDNDGRLPVRRNSMIVGMSVSKRLAFRERGKAE